MYATILNWAAASSTIVKSDAPISIFFKTQNNKIILFRKEIIQKKEFLNANVLLKVSYRSYLRDKQWWDC